MSVFPVTKRTKLLLPTPVAPMTAITISFRLADIFVTLSRYSDDFAGMNCREKLENDER
jgi:hypothetical protein